MICNSFHNNPCLCLYVFSSMSLFLCVTTHFTHSMRKLNAFLVSFFSFFFLFSCFFFIFLTFRSSELSNKQQQQQNQRFTFGIFIKTNRNCFPCVILRWRSCEQQARKMNAQQTEERKKTHWALSGNDGHLCVTNYIVSVLNEQL